MSYATIIRQCAPCIGTRDPRHVEAYLRLQYGTLDALSRDMIRREARSIIGAIDADPAMAERLAQSYGL